MTRLKSALLASLLAGLTLGNNAWPRERPPRLGELQSASKKPAQAQSAPETPAKKPAKRRAVRQVLDDDVRPAAPPAMLAPGLTPAPALTPPGVAPAPSQLHCVGATCSDPDGGRFNGGVGSSLISPQGKLCNNNGMTVQCF